MNPTRVTISSKIGSADDSEVKRFVADHPDLYSNTSEFVRKAIKRELAWARSNLGIPTKNAQKGPSATPPMPESPCFVSTASEAPTEPQKGRVCARPSNKRKSISSLWKDITLSATRAGDGG